MTPTAILLLWAAFISPVTLKAESEADLDRLISENNTSLTSEKTGDTDLLKKFKIFGFVETSNHFSIPATGSINDYKIIKAEARGQLDLQYRTGSFFTRATLDAYFYPETTGSDDNSNSSGVYHQVGRLEAREVYAGFGKNLQFKIGKQLFTWGSADAFNVTNYLDQPDLRELFLRDRDDKNRGVLALSIKYLIGDYALEAAFLPIHSPAQAPLGFWELSPSAPAFNVEINHPSSAAASLKNSAASVRFGGTAGFIDFHASYFTGYNHDLMYESAISGTSFSERLIELTPYFDRRHTFGIDLAGSLNSFSFRGEVAFSLNMPALYKQDETTLAQIYQYWELAPNQSKDIDTIMTELAGGGAVFPSGPEKEKHISYVVGADYNFRGSNGLILIEWIQGYYLDHGNRYDSPLFDSILLVRIEDKFFNEQFSAEAGTMIRPIQKKPGASAFCEAGWDFKNGFTLNLGGYIFFGNGDELFESLKDKDMLYFKARYLIN